MGTTSVDTQREIERLRDDISAVAAEVEGRLRRVVNVSARVKRLQNNPPLAAAVGLGVLASLGVAAVVGVAIGRRGAVSDRSAPAVAAPPVTIAVPLPEPKGSTMIKRIMWSALTAAVMALGALAARRLSAEIWKAAMQEEPPDGTS